MSAEANKALMRRWLEEVTNAQQLHAIDEVLAPTFVDHGLCLISRRARQGSSGSSP
jgi:hypothetical protein